MGPEDLSILLSYLPKQNVPGLLSGLDDDAATYSVNENLAIVQTLDFITPVVDDPYSFGAIAAANAISDIYAMGARPIFALNIVSFPIRTMPMETLGAILAGGAAKAGEAGFTIVGGHSVDDASPKYGLSVTGLVDPHKLIRKNGALVGDALILTKPLGTGILASGIDAGIVEDEVEAALTAVMLELNLKAAQVMQAFPVHACTDVSGFGLLGHLREMLNPDLSAQLDYDKLPILPQVWDVLKYGGISGGTHSNARYLGDQVQWEEKITFFEQMVLFDAQTSGGLLMAVPAEAADSMISELNRAGTLAANIIGYIGKRTDFPIKVRRGLGSENPF
ncbi:selenide, water dikinase SelD [Desulfosporosinus nitroreducens]|uniref:selenide, water dikinase SelD n=1 Tax=Desulfosporosinus nitroreducens TaxID=2018668 RepID=UPI0028526830|nr:selenide, water dikinase SelD [Desulfosporosinus nitroreducens]